MPDAMTLLSLDDCTCDLLDKNRSNREYVKTMLNRTSMMFEYDGLPETIPVDMLELFLQLNGNIAFIKENGKLYALPGGLGGPPDPYYRQVLYVIANPALGIGKSYKILNYLNSYETPDYEGECVLMKNDTMMTGLKYMFARYATQMTENDISIRCAQINSRQQTLISASTDTEAYSGAKYIESIENGKWSVIAEKAFLEGIKAVNVSTQSSNSIIQLIELQQYLKASWFNEIGLNANFNMKREYLSTEELRSSTDVLLPMIDDMLKCREEAIALVNSTFGTNITVKKNSAWESKQESQDIELEKSRAEVRDIQEEGGADG